jgi:hypothetical protein
MFTPHRQRTHDMHIKSSLPSASQFHVPLGFPDGQVKRNAPIDALSAPYLNDGESNDSQSLNIGNTHWCQRDQWGRADGWQGWQGGQGATRVLQLIEETAEHARTFARKFCVSGHLLDLLLRPARTFPLSGWPKFWLPLELWLKASGKLGPLGRTSGQP